MSVRIRPGDEPAWQWPEASDIDRADGSQADTAQEWLVRPERGRSARDLLGNWPRATAGIMLAAVGLLVVGGLAYRLSVPAPTAAPPMDPPPTPTPTASPATPDVAADRPAMSAVPWQGAALPISDTAGPQVFTETRATGFTRDPQGAAVAAVHISTHIDPFTGPAVFTPTIEEQVMVTGGVEDLVRRTQKLYEKAAAARDLTSQAVADGVPILAPTGDISAWRIGTFRSDGVTTVELLVTTPQGERLIYEVPVIWRDGDWRVTFEGASAAEFRVTATDDTTDFTTFIERVSPQGGNKK